MMGVQFIAPVFASVLYVIVFQKAGFKGAIMAVCAAPLLGALLSYAIYWMLISGSMGPGMMALPLIAIPLSLAPLLVLAFKPWPPVTRLEGNQIE